jgi:N-carbamoylputrescine amidase
MKQQNFTIGIVQQPCGDADAQVNVERAVGNIREAAARGAQIICLPEMFNSPYFCKVESQDRFNIAEPIPGPTVERMQALARELGVVIIVPIFERRAAGVYHNSAAVVDADGSLLGVYRKMHIPDDPLYYEKFYFTPGDADGPTRGFKVFDTKFARIGVLICWDQWYPEGARITSLMGAEVLFYPTAIGWHPKEKAVYGPSQMDAWRTAQRAHAIANGVYVAAPNRIGLELEPGTDGIEFFGHSFISDPFGRIVADAGVGVPNILVTEIDRFLIEDTRRHWPFLRDRRIDAYGPILNRWIDTPGRQR